MNEDPRFDPLVRTAYERIFKQQEAPENVIRSLVEGGENETLAGMAVHSAFEQRHEEALACKLDYSGWLVAVARDIWRSGKALKVLALISAAVAAAALYWIAGPTLLERSKLFFYFVTLVVGVLVFLIGSVPVYLYSHWKTLNKNGQ